MKRNTFGDPQPKGAAEISEALGERDINEPWGTISLDEESDPPFAGWSAELSGKDSDGEDIDSPINTLGYPTKEALIADLEAAGVKRSDLTVV